VTYPFGRDVDIAGLRIFRCLRPPFIRRVRIGPSLAKVPLDAALALTALRRVLARRYDAIHSHEEGGLIGAVLARLAGVPHLYDMHSSLPQQLENFGFSRSRLLRRLFDGIERFVVRRSRVVIVICPHLAEIVRGIDPGAEPVLIENAPGASDEPATCDGAHVRQELGLEPTTPMVLYTGTFEPYQGLDLLFEAAGRVLAVRPEVTFVLVGGGPDQVEDARGQARAAGVERGVRFTGQRPASAIPGYLEAATVLVSPRRTGWNTPLKIYQYLRSGRPTVATRLLTHTQVLDDTVAVLTEPTAEAFAAGILSVLGDQKRAGEIAARARHLADTKYSYEAYLERTRRACARLVGEAPGHPARGAA
jgi:glycosyltransferase involved in cell wall biosynthesis